MASGYNKVILLGNVTRDPELRYTPRGTAVTDLGVAVTTVRGKGTERKEDTVFVDVTVWDRLAEICGEYLKKGRPILVEGRLVLDEWEDKQTGEKRRKLKVIAENIQFIGGREGGKNDSNEGMRASASPEPPSRNKGLGTKEEKDIEEGEEGEDIPF